MNFWTHRALSPGIKNGAKDEFCPIIPNLYCKNNSQQLIYLMMMKGLICLLVLMAIAQTCSDAHCVSCPTSSYCQECTAGYRVSGGYCLKCTDAGCAACPNTISTCTQCLAGYRLSGGNCLKCTDTHCLECLNTVSTCTKCAAGYVLSSGYCRAAIITSQ